MPHKYFKGDMNPYYPSQDQYANNISTHAGVPWTSKCEDKLTPLGISVGCSPKNRVYYAIDNGCYRVNLVLSTNIPIDHVSIEFLKINPTKSEYQKINLTDMEIKVVRKDLKKKKIITFINEGYPPSVRGLDLLPFGCSEEKKGEIDDPKTKTELAEALKKSVDLMDYLLRAEV